MNFLFTTNVAYASVDSFLSNANRLIVNPLIGLLFALAVVYFLYGVFEFLLNQENDEKKTTGKSHMLWGVIGIGIMMSVWFIIQVILSTLGVKGVDVSAPGGQGQIEVDLPE